MKMYPKFLALLFPALVLAGCVTSHYVNDKGFECTRRYFAPLGIPTHSCSETKAVAEQGKAKGEALKVAPAAPSPSLRRTTPAKAIEQSIKSTQALR